MVRPNSPPQTTSVSSSRPRCFRSVSRARVGWSMSRHWLGRSRGQHVVLVPAAVEDLGEADSAFREAAGQQAVVGGRCRACARRARTCRGSDSGSLSEVGEFGDGGLHAEGHLVLGDAVLDDRVADRLEAVLVERVDAVDHVAAQLAADPGRIAEVEHRIAAAAEGDAGVLGLAASRCPRAGRRAPGLLAPVQVALSTTKVGRFSLRLPRP